ncbi:MAG: serine hydroxymethyltransferase, partial [Cyanobacteria bacterium J06639_16]
SGLRLGSPAMTTRGMGTDEFVEIANIIADRLLDPDNDATTQGCRQRVAALCDRFPLYPHLSIPVPVLA